MTMTSSRSRPEGPAREYHGSASSVEDLSLTRNESPCLGLDPFSFRKSRVDLQVEAGGLTAGSLARPRSDHLFYLYQVAFTWDLVPLPRKPRYLSS